MATPVHPLRNLVDQLVKAREERTSLEAKCDRLEGTLARAENRIAQLSPLNGGEEGIVTPGVSRKVLESLTKENTKLKEALEHLTQRKDGPNLVVENKDLHEIIVTLRDERDEKVKQVEQLLQSLTAVENKDPRSQSSQVARLTFEVTSLEKKLRVKDVLLQTLMDRYEAAMKALQEAQGEKVAKVGDLKEQLGSAMKTERELGDLFDRVWDGDGQEKEIAKDVKETDANIKAHLVAHTRNDGKDGHVEMGLNHDENEKALQTTIVKLNEELEKEKRETGRLQEELTKSAQPAQGALQQLNELQEALAVMQKERDELLTESAIMKTQITGYEDEFKMERQEKEKAMRPRKVLEADKAKLVDCNNRLRKDNDLLKQRVPTNPFSQPLTGYMPLAEPCCRGGPDDGQVRASPVARPRTRGNGFECPGCRKLLPHDELDHHMRACCI